MLDVVDPEKVKHILEENDNDSEAGDIEILQDLQGSDDEDSDEDIVDNENDDEERDGQFSDSGKNWCQIPTGFFLCVCV